MYVKGKVSCIYIHDIYYSKYIYLTVKCQCRKMEEVHRIYSERGTPEATGGIKHWDGILLG